MTTGGVDCWGYNYLGYLGNGNRNDSSTPVQVLGISGSGTILGGVKSISVFNGNSAACAVLTTGGVDCWGYNENYGQLGNGTTTSSNVPVSVVGIP